MQTHSYTPTPTVPKKQDSPLIRIIKFLPYSWQLAILSIGFLQRREIYKTNIPGMLPMLDEHGHPSSHLTDFLNDNGLAGTQSIAIEMEGGVKLHVLSHASRNGKYVCAFHGIKGNWLNNPTEPNSSDDYNPNYRMEVLKHFVQDGFGFLAFSMPGFEPSGGKPSEVNFNKACEAFAEYTIANIRTAPENIIVWGESLGTANAAIFANKMTEKRRPPGVVSLVAPFDSMINMVRYTFPYFSEEVLAKHLSEKLDTKGRLTTLDREKTYIHIVSANNDNVIPLDRVLNLVYRARELGLQVLYHPTEGRHTTWNALEVLKGKMVTHLAREAGVSIAAEQSVTDIESILAKTGKHQAAARSEDKVTRTRK